MSTLYVRDAHGNFSVADGDALVIAARRHLDRRVRRGVQFRSPDLVKDYLITRLGTLDHEVFCLITLDSRHRLIEFTELFRGTVDGATVHPREVVKLALKQNAAAVIFAHNHPSGVAEPSHADELITNRLREALGLVDIRTLDHLVVAGACSTSFVERGLL